MNSCTKFLQIPVLVLSVLLTLAQAQTTTPPSRQVNQQVQTWVSLNTTYRLNRLWGTMSDVHIRRTDFVQDPSFYFIRFGPNFWIRNNLTASVGYAHLWTAPPREDYQTWGNENRISEQVVFSSRAGSTTILQRLRNEQRWQQRIVNDERTGLIRFTNRVRYLVSFTFPVSTNPRKPALVVAEEFLLQFGKDVVYNTFDQNRLFIGIRQPLNKQWSYDFGYMNVYQQLSSGYQYNMNHTIRLFFYFQGSRWQDAAAVGDHHQQP